MRGKVRGGGLRYVDSAEAMLERQGATRCSSKSGGGNPSRGSRGELAPAWGTLISEMYLAVVTHLQPILDVLMSIPSSNLPGIIGNALALIIAVIGSLARGRRCRDRLVVVACACHARPGCFEAERSYQAGNLAPERSVPAPKVRYNSADKGASQ